MADPKTKIPQLSEFLKDFIDEAKELLEKLDRDCVFLEKDPKNKKLIDDIFRSVHTLKATFGFMGLNDAKILFQNLESLLTPVRDGTLPLSQSIMNVIFEVLTLMKRLLESVIKGKKEEIDSTETLSKIKRLMPGNTPTSLEAEQKQKEPEGIVPKEEESQLLPTIRIDAKKLDEIMNIVGELITGRNRMNTLIQRLRNEPIERAQEFINRAIDDLQAYTLDLRMTPMSGILNRFPRLVRDLALLLKKEITLEIVGEQTVLDKTMIEKLYDPLIHLIRNAASHGIEIPEEREKKKKPKTGTLRVEVRQEQETVKISVEDDGKGIDPKLIRSIAQKKNLISEELAQKMTDEEAIQLIFLPGFSVVEEATEVSGRGVGMDVVKTNVRQMGGRVDIQSKVDQGTKVSLNIPMTLLIQTVMEIQVESHQYAVPLNSVQEVLTVEKKDIQGVKGKKTAPYHQKRLPLLWLRELFGIQMRFSEKEDPQEKVIVLKSGEDQVGLVIDEILGKEDVVVKSLGQYLGEVKGISGMTLLGTGRVMLILDVFTLVRFSKSLSENPNTEFKKYNFIFKEALDKISNLAKK